MKPQICVMTKYRFKTLCLSVALFAMAEAPSFSQEQMTPDDSKAFRSAIKMADKCDNRGAIGILRGLYDKYPENLSVAYNLGVCYINASGNPDSTLFFLNRVNELDDNETWDDARIELNLAMARAKQLCGKPKEAIAIYDEIEKGDTLKAYTDMIKRERMICESAIVLMNQPVHLVMRYAGDAVTDAHKVSRAKLAYLIDATAAPICIIAPISSWAAAVSSSVPEGSDINGFTMFLQTIPYNFYALLTITMMLTLTFMKFEYGPMATHEKNALENGDLFTTAGRPYGDGEDAATANPKGKVIDLVLPVALLVLFCIIGLIYTGGFFSGVPFITAFADCDASAGLVYGSVVALIVMFFYYMIRGVVSFQEFADCIPSGFKAMVPAILILSFAWTLSGMTNLLGGADYVGALVHGSAAGMQKMLPAIIFLVASVLAFATGTSWGTFGILIPIVVEVFPAGTMLIVSIAACLAGAVCGDHCSPISDTTIMSSAGAQSDHVNHVSTQLPYALTVGGVCFVSYIIAGFVQNIWISLPIAIALMIGTLYAIKAITTKKA